MIESLGWGTFLLWGVFDSVIGLTAFFLLQETKGLSLETIAQQNYGTDPASQTATGPVIKDVHDEDVHQ
jgi:hypothetical protein